MSNKEKFIIHTANSLARRMNLCRMVHFVSFAMLWGFVLTALVVLLSKFWLLPISVLIISGLIIILSVILGTIMALRIKVSSMDAFIKAESRLNLKERLSSALEFSLQDKRSHMAELQLGDAYQHCRSIDPKIVCPKIFTLSSKLLPLFAILLISLTFIPTWYADPYYVPPEVRQGVKETAAELDKKMDELASEKLSDQGEELISEVKAAARNMQDETVSKKDALLILSNLNRKAEALEIMARLSHELDKEELTTEQKRLIGEMLDKLYDKLKDMDELEQIAQSIQKAQKSDLSGESLKELISALDHVGSPSADADSMGQISDQLEEARKQIASIGIKSGGEQAEDESQIETGLNTTSGGAPGDNTVSDVNGSGDQEYIAGEVYDVELESLVDESGRGISAEIVEEQDDDVKATVPYREIYVEYRNAADEAISRKSIPWAYRKHVKDYFDAIKPKEKSDGN